MSIYLRRLLGPLIHRVPVRRLATSNDSQSSNSDNSSNNDYEDDAEIFDRDFADMKTEDFRQLYESPDASMELKDPQLIKEHIDTILNEYEQLKYNSVGRVPSLLTLVDMSRLIKEGTTASVRSRMFNYYFKREMSKRSGQMRRIKEKEETQERLSKKFQEMESKLGKQYRTGLLTEEGHLMYGLWHNSLVCRIPEIKLKQAGSEANLIHAALYGKRIVFDFQYDSFMTPQTIRSSIEQVQDSYGINRFHTTEPFDLWFCNFNESSPSGKYLTKHCIQNLYTGSMITVKPDCFTNYFDKSKLVYLSPDSKDKLGQVNNDDVYVIGVYNDKGKSQPLSFRRAQQLGIRCKSLPLDSYVAWQGGSKSLCINHVVGSLLEVWNNGGDWRKALVKWLPSRKLKSIEQVRDEQARRMVKMHKRKPSFSIRIDTL